MLAIDHGAPGIVVIKGRLDAAQSPAAQAFLDGVQGTVTLRAIIATNGSIANLQLVEGHPFLVSAAIDAVRQWRYRPYMLSGVPVEVETTIFVNFHLDH